jgi:hypothetical protein
MELEVPASYAPELAVRLFLLVLEVILLFKIITYCWECSCLWLWWTSNQTVSACWCVQFGGWKPTFRRPYCIHLQVWRSWSKRCIHCIVAYQEMYPLHCCLPGDVSTALLPTRRCIHCIITYQDMYPPHCYLPGDVSTALLPTRRCIHRIVAYQERFLMHNSRFSYLRNRKSWFSG